MLRFNHFSSQLLTKPLSQGKKSPTKQTSRQNIGKSTAYSESNDTLYRLFRLGYFKNLPELQDFEKCSDLAEIHTTKRRVKLQLALRGTGLGQK